MAEQQTRCGTYISATVIWASCEDVHQNEDKKAKRKIYLCSGIVNGGQVCETLPPWALRAYVYYI